jgi:predicted ATPase/DNA-binding winged helix-turn-helix (wHTH) protein
LSSTSRPLVVLLDVGSVDLSTGRLDRRGEVVELTPIEASLLAALAARPHVPHSPATLLREVWGYASGVQSRTVYATVNRLRAKIEVDPAQPTRLITLPGRGYCFRLRSDPESTPPPPGQASESPAGDRFVGRTRELARLLEQLGNQGPLVTLVGPGGVGKTRLADEFARRFQDSGGDAVRCDLTAARDQAGVEFAVARVLGVSAGDGLETALRDLGPSLLILDNFEQVVDFAVTTVGRWRGLAPSTRFLVTSRAPLLLGAEVLIEVEPLPTQAAIAMLLDRASRHDAEWAAGVSRATLRTIVEQLDRIPLAIELAAARARLVGPAELLTRLSDRFRLLASRRRDLPDRHRTLDAAIRWSWDLLTPWEQDALAQLSVFRGGLTLESAEAVLDLTGHPEAPWIPDVVASLRDHSLLFSGAPRLYLLESIREFAGARLEESEAAHAAAVRHAEYFAAFGEPGRLGGLAGPSGVALHRSLGRELDNLLAASRFAIDADMAETAGAAAQAALAVLLTRGPFARALELAERAAKLPDLPLSRRVGLLRSAGRAAQLAGETDRAIGILEGALPVAVSGGSATDEGLIRLTLGVLERAAGELDKAQAWMQGALDGFREAGDQVRTGLALTGLGNLDVERGLLDRAEAAYVEARGLHVAAGNRRGEGTAEADLAGIARLRGDADRATIHFNRGRAIFKEVDDRRAEAVLVGNHGDFLLGTGDGDAAAFRLEEAVSILEEIEFPGALGAFCGALGEARRSQGRAAEGRALLDRGERLLRRVGDRTELAKLLCRVGWAAAESGDRSRAVQALEEAEAIRRDQGLDTGSLLGTRCFALRQALAADP